MKNFIIFFFSLTLLSTFSACQKDSFGKISKGLPRMEEALVLATSAKNGAIGLTSQKTFDAVSLSGQKNLWQVRGKFWGDDNKSLHYGNISLDDFILMPAPSGIYQSEAMLNNPELKPLFGKTVLFSLDNGDAERTVVFQSGLYVPADITVSSPVKTMSNQELPNNTVITWNADANNDKGVYILIEFDPEDEDNSAFNNGNLPSLMALTASTNTPSIPTPWLSTILFWENSTLLIYVGELKVISPKNFSDMKNLFLPLLAIGLMALASCTKQSQLDWFMPNVAAPNPSLSASFRINNTNNTVNEQAPVSISNLSTQAVAYHWDFGNGATSTEKTPALAYSKCGIYTITLTVTGADGSTQKATQEVTTLCIFGGVHDSF